MSREDNSRRVKKPGPARWAALALLAGLVSSSAGANHHPSGKTPIELPLDHSGVSLNEHVDIHQGEAPEFVRAEVKQSLDIGGSPDAVWAVFTIQETSSYPREWVLVFSPAVLERVTLYRLTPSSALVVGRFEINDRHEGSVLPVRKPTFVIQSETGKQVTYLAKIESTLPMWPSLRISSREEADQWDSTEHLWFGNYSGIFSAIFLLNLLLYFATRDRSNLHYVQFMFCMGLTVATLGGYMDFHVPGSFVFSRYIGFLAAVTMILAHRLTRTFLQTRRRFPLGDRMHQALICIGFALALLNLSPWLKPLSHQFGHWIDLSMIVSMAAIYFSTLVVLRRGHAQASYFLAAWTPLFVMTVVYFSANYGLIPSSEFTRFGVQIGSSLEMILLSLAIVKRVQSLERAKALAEEQVRQSKRLRSLVHLICHDLRNPLTVVATHAQVNRMLGKPEWDPVIKAVEQQKSILDFVRMKEELDTGKRSLKLVPVGLREAFENSRFVFEDQIARKRLQIRVRIAPENLEVLADPTALSQTVMSNLLSNAIKFSPEGAAIELSAETQELPGDGAWVKIELRDQGAGIPSELLPHLFSDSAPTNRPGTLGETGSGFGMPLVHSIVDSFGGRIEIESRDQVAHPGSPGTTVKLWLQCARKMADAELLNPGASLPQADASH